MDFLDAMVTNAQELAGCRERLRWTEMHRSASVLLLSCTAAASGVGGGESSSRVERFLRCFPCLTHHTLTTSLFCALRESRININSSPSPVNACPALKVVVVWEPPLAVGSRWGTPWTTHWFITNPTY